MSRLKKAPVVMEEEEDSRVSALMREFLCSVVLMSAWRSAQEAGAAGDIIAHWLTRFQQDITLIYPRSTA